MTFLLKRSKTFLTSLKIHTCKYAFSMYLQRTTWGAPQFCRSCSKKRYALFNYANSQNMTTLEVETTWWVVAASCNFLDIFFLKMVSGLLGRDQFMLHKRTYFTVRYIFLSTCCWICPVFSPQLYNNQHGFIFKCEILFVYFC